VGTDSSTSNPIIAKPYPPGGAGHDSTWPRGDLLLERECVVQLRALECGMNGPALGPVALEVLLGVGRVCLFGVRVRGIGLVVQVGHLLTPVGLPDPRSIAHTRGPG